MILFGASDSGKDVYQKLESKYDIIGFFDNDKTKQGKKICGIPVFAPRSLDDIRAEGIVICSHQWKDIYEQLTKDFNITEEKIRVGHSLLQKADLTSDVKILEVNEVSNEVSREDEFGIYWLLGYQCNYACSYCFYKMKEKTMPKVSDIQIKNVVDNIASLQNKRVKVDLVGGEPTIFPHYRQLVLNLEKLPNVDIIQTETNLSKDLEFFEGLFNETVNTKKLAFIASYHFEFAKQKEFIEKILLFNKYNIRIDVVLMAHPEKLQEVKGIIDVCNTYDIASVKFQLAVVLDMGIPDTRYRKSDLEWIKATNDMFGDNSDRSDRSVCIKYESKGSVNEIKMNPRKSIADGFNNFKNMQCMAGMNSIRINEKGDVFPAMCFWENNKGDFYRGKNILNSNEQIYFDSPVICPFSCCLVPSDLQIRKRRLP